MARTVGAKNKPILQRILTLVVKLNEDELNALEQHIKTLKQTIDVVSGESEDDE